MNVPIQWPARSLFHRHMVRWKSFGESASSTVSYCHHHTTKTRPKTRRTPPHDAGLRAQPRFRARNRSNKDSTSKRTPNTPKAGIAMERNISRIKEKIRVGPTVALAR